MPDTTGPVAGSLATFGLAALLVGCHRDAQKPPETDGEPPAEAHDLSRLGVAMQPARSEPAPRPDPRVLLRRPTVRGALPRSTAARVIRSHAQDIRFCYDQALQHDPSLEGVVTISFEIDVEGRTSSVFVLGSSVADASVSRCIARATRQWRFPSPRDGRRVRVTYPVVLEPG